MARLHGLGNCCRHHVTPLPLEDCTRPAESEAKGQRTKRIGLGKVLGKTEAKVAGPDVGRASLSGRNTKDPRIMIKPGTAPAHAPVAITTIRFEPCRSVRWCSFIGVMPAILDPFHNIAAHVIYTGPTGFLAANYLSTMSMLVIHRIEK